MESAEVSSPLPQASVQSVLPPSPAFHEVSLQVLLSPYLLSLATPQKHQGCWMDVSGNHPPLSLFLLLETAYSLDVLASSCHLDPNPPDLILDLLAMVSEEMEES